MPRLPWTGPIARLVLLSVVLAWIAVAASAETPKMICDADDPPWSKDLVEPDDITPENGVLDTMFVVREKPQCIPVWSSNLCKGTFLRCTDTSDKGKVEWPCSTTTPCVNAKTCLGSGASCSRDSDCTDEPKKCVQAWGWEMPMLRTYGYPDPDRAADAEIDPSDPNEENLKWALPGPTLRARSEILKDPSAAKSSTNPAVEEGTRIKLLLHNYLSPRNYDDRKKCDPSGPNYEPTFPECFFGSEITNLHYHGSHVSPLPHQDYVLLELWPFGSEKVPVSPDTDTPKLGSYQTDINPLPWNQAPGTHWYHPHKHGSTSIQVLNGMSGALLVDGPFDDWLKRFYERQGGLTERLLVVQQVQEELNFFNKDIPDFPPQLLINGQATPRIQMAPGEIQRFRFIGATVQASASVEIGFDERIEEVRQIAQDGVQFAWQNFDRQPYRDAEGTYRNFDLSPGNRADFLIQAPMKEGTYVIEQNVFVKGLKDRVRREHATEETLMDRIPDMAPLLKMMVEGVGVMSAPVDPGSGKPLLFTIEVMGPERKMSFPVTQGTDRACADTNPPERCWPKTPAYLADLPVPREAAREIDFSMKGPVGGTDDAPPSFFINRTQYNHSCANATMYRSEVEDWKVGNVKYTPGSNDGLMAHPFHIHVNPFQMVRNADRSFDPPYVWQDTVALPVIDQIKNVKVAEGDPPISNRDDAIARCPSICDGDGHATWVGEWTENSCACQTVTSRPAGPIWSNQDADVKCPRACNLDDRTWNGNWRTTIFGRLSECDCVKRSDSVQIRHRFDDYTGAYVIHCHFLGHEDRGMMWNVQTTCSPDEPLIFGTPRSDGGPDKCAQSSSDAFPPCDPSMGHGSH